METADRLEDEVFLASVHSGTSRSSGCTRGRRPSSKTTSSRCTVNRYYDPANDQFVSVDPLVDHTLQPYVFTGDDPLNVTDPLGLSWYNPSWVHRAWHRAIHRLNAVRHAAASVGHWVEKHPQVAIGIGLGALAVATGGAGLAVEAGVIEASTTTSLALSTTAVASGTGATVLDGRACVHGDHAACVGAGLGAVGTLAGGGPLLASEAGLSACIYSWRCGIESGSWSLRSECGHGGTHLRWNKGNRRCEQSLTPQPA